MESWTVS